MHGKYGAQITSFINRLEKAMASYLVTLSRTSAVYDRHCVSSFVQIPAVLQLTGNLAVS